ncbi:COR domain-containing protein [Prosthecobacter sp.]|uniref:leucine-rich repeat domain-containing protein n=1 Tax=Prosthecobacter sp. TaxID=1965333 RepID=UPI00378518E9
MPPPKMTPQEQQAYDEALKQINECRKLGKRGMELNLSGLSLTALPPEIGQLTALTELDLSGTQLSALPHEIGELTALTTLDLSHTQFSALPHEIGQLTALTTLYLIHTKLSALPPEIGQLTALTGLYLQGTQLSALPPEIGLLTVLTTLSLYNTQLSALPPEIGQLTALTTLYLYNTQLSALPPEIGQLTALTTLDLHNTQLIALPPEIGQLTALTELFLYNTQLSELPPEIGQLTALTTLDLSGTQLSALPEELRQLKNLEALYLHDNPRLKLPPEVLGPTQFEVGTQDKTPANPQTILDYYFGRQAKDSRPLNEVKLILVGRGGAGKTSTVRALKGLPFNTQEESTPGIALSDWDMGECQGGPVTAHVWDFAGQVITHALHQFFFSVRSVYVLVLSGRENHEREDAEYWLRLIRAFGTDGDGQGPPVIVVLNQWDVPGCRPKVDRGALQERYPFIAGFVEMDCQTRTGVDKLKTALCSEVDQLKWIREPFKPEWVAVRQALADGGKQRAHLSFTEYRALCARHGVTDEREQESLSDILHNLGAALNYRNDPRLREATVLQPLWLTQNVYGLVRRAEEQYGVLKQADVDAVLAQEKDEKMRQYLLQIMERFEIAYVPRSAGGGVWLVPQALPIEQPKGVESFGRETDATHLRYTYEALPEGLVARAIVRLHEFIEEVDGKPQQWASGAVLTREGARALLRAETATQVMITVTGPAKARQQLAGLCQAEMRDINAEIKRLDPVEETRVKGDWISTAILDADERNRRQTGIRVPAEGTVMIDPRGPNDEFSTPQARQDDLWKPTIFISYSKSNVAQRKRLESELKILRNEGLLESHWHDRMIDPGDEWDKKIQRELREADVILILISAASLSTDYITEHEIPKAMKLHKAGETIVVPIVLESCRWDKTALGALNALPDKAKALNNWKPSSEGWHSVSNGLARVLEKLMKESPERVAQPPPVSGER